MSKMVIGIDNGYEYTKDSNNHIFRSQITEIEPIGYGGYDKLEVDGKTYYIGAGTGTLEIDKADSLINKICTLYCLALYDETEFNLVVGLPIEQYQSDKEKFKKAVLSWSGAKVKLNDKEEKKIIISEVYVFSQGLSSLYASDVRTDVIILDVGSRTVDVAYIVFENDTPIVKKTNTYYCGCLQLYSNIIKAVNAKYQLTLTNDDAKGILTHGLTIEGKSVDIEFLEDTYKKHFDELFKNLELNYPSKTVPFLLCGGGASLLAGPIKNKFKNVSTLKHNQFSNALGYKTIGGLLWR